MPIGQVVAAFGKRYEVLVDSNPVQNQIVSCVRRGKKADLACGDLVEFSFTAINEGIIETIQPRQHLLYRSDAYKSKTIAANVTQVVFVLAPQPAFYETLLNRCLAAAQAAEIKTIIVVNKADLLRQNPAENDRLQEKIAVYKALSLTIIELSALENIAPLRAHLQNEHSILVGQSGMGKSSIINALLPNAAAQTREISQVLDSGKHTTTSARLYYLDAQSTLIDSPGLQEFGLHHLSASEIAHAFIEFKPYLGLCKFNNCSHTHEPECAILNAFKIGKIAESRLRGYQSIIQEHA